MHPTGQHVVGLVLKVALLGVLWAFKMGALMRGSHAIGKVPSRSLFDSPFITMQVCLMKRTLVLEKNPYPEP